MEVQTIIDALKKLENARLYRAPQNIREFVEPWFKEFELMSINQFENAIAKIVKNETAWPAIATIYRYAEKEQEELNKKKCPFCENTGFLLIKTNNKNIAYACKCEIGQRRRQNLKIASYESLGIPWPEEEIEDYSKKGRIETKKLIKEFLEKVGKDIPVGESG